MTTNMSRDEMLAQGGLPKGATPDTRLITDRGFVFNIYDARGYLGSLRAHSAPEACDEWVRLTGVTPRLVEEV